MIRQRDKQLHFIGGAVIAALTLAFGLGPWWAIFLTIVVAVGKEVRDNWGYGTCDPWDAIATIAGGVIATLVIVDAIAVLTM